MQLAFIGWLLYQIYKRLKGTQAERVLRGLVFLVPAIIACYFLKLTIITRLIEILSSTLLIGLIVIFAPEFRRLLMQIGGEIASSEFMLIPESKKKLMKTADELVDAVENLSKNKVGALIVIEKAKVDRYYVNPGHPINADVTKELLLTIFTPRTALHDGAVTIRGASILSAGVILPMTENPKLDWQYGTRHRAAIGFSEVTDSLCVVISEETGDLSIAYEGRITRHESVNQVRSAIEKYYASVYKTTKKKKNLAKQVKELFDPIISAKFNNTAPVKAKSKAIKAPDTVNNQVEKPEK